MPYRERMDPPPTPGPSPLGPPVPQPVGQRRQHNGQNKYMPGSGPAVEQRCPDTGSGFIMGGPIWADAIHDPTFIQGRLPSC